MFCEDGTVTGELGCRRAPAQQSEGKTSEHEEDRPGGGEGEERGEGQKALGHFKGLGCGPCVTLSLDASDKLSLLSPG